MDISARAFSLADRPRLDHLGHQCSHAPGRPNLHLVSSSRRPRLETVDRVTSSLAPDIAQFLCSSQGPFLRPGPQNVDRAGRRGGQGRPSLLATAGPALPGCTLTVRARREDQAGRTPASSVLASSKARPLASTAAGKLVGERDREHVVVQPPLGGFDPGFEPVTLPVLYPDQHNPCRPHCDPPGRTHRCRACSLVRPR